jgi:sulfatase maturation enzyme AslB (radical SAM superfamily)
MRSAESFVNGLDASFTEFVFKTQSNCNLRTRYDLGGIAIGGCDYCYEYAADSTWRDEPPLMDVAVMRQGARRIGEHALLHSLGDVRVINHGGEPLLSSAKRLDVFSTVVGETIGQIASDTKVHLYIQTNGTLLSEEKLEVLRRHRYTIGLSLLLPHANHSTPPRQSTQAYGEWLMQAFDWYLQRPEGSRIAMPIFDSYMDTLLGGITTHEAVSLHVVRELFILASGAYQRVDTLKSTEPGAAKTNMNVFEHSLDDVVARDPGIRARRLARAALADECKECPLVVPCGGGYYPHRFKANDRPLKPTSPVEDYVAAFQHPSVYCETNTLLLNHIAKRLGESLGVASGSLINFAAG